jgi:membrane protein implicated in regulation of membrane protease activity
MSISFKNRERLVRFAEIARSEGFILAMVMGAALAAAVAYWLAWTYTAVGFIISAAFDAGRLIYRLLGPTRYPTRRSE